MGKVKRGRTRLHLKAPEVMDAEPAVAIPLPPAVTSDSLAAHPSPLTSAAAPVFASVEIPLAALRQTLPDLDARSVVSGVSTASGVGRLKKRDKQKARRAALIHRLDTVAQNLREAQARKRRLKTPVVGDMRPLASALPDLTSLQVATVAPAGGGVKLAPVRSAPASLKTSDTRRLESRDAGRRKGMPKKRVRHRQFMEDMQQFMRVVQHPSYQRDPTGVISEHVQQWVLRDVQRPVT